MSADLNLVERAEILAAAVMFAVLDCAANVLICVFGSHNKISLGEIFAVFRRRFILSFAESFILGKNSRKSSAAKAAKPFFIPKDRILQAPAKARRGQYDG